jgi:glycosyltransferase involved in cell wall biosynthesis
MDRHLPEDVGGQVSEQDKPSVLLVGNFLSGHVGNFSVCEDLAKQLRTAGLNVTTTSDRKPRGKRLLDIVSTVWRKRHQYNVAHVDVYSGLGFGLAEAACFALRAAGKPYVLTLRGGGLPEFAKKWPRRVGRLFQAAAVVTTPSDFLMEHMRSFRDDMQLIPNPLHLQRYPFRLRRPAAAKLVWVRSFHGIYHPTMAPRVVAALASDFPDVHLTMVGPDKGDGSLQATQQVAEELAVADRIRFTGGVPKESVPDHLCEADILINTTNVDNTPTTVLEAMACGLCVVSTDVGGVPYLVSSGENALLVPPREPEKMAAAVRQILSTPELAASLSDQAREFAGQFDWAAILPQWLSLLGKVAKQPSASRKPPA